MALLHLLPIVERCRLSNSHSSPTLCPAQRSVAVVQSTPGVPLATRLSLPLACRARPPPGAVLLSTTTVIDSDHPQAAPPPSDLQQSLANGAASTDPGLALVAVA